MGVTVATTRVACNTSTGTQDITTADLGDLTPKAALLIVTYATTDGTAADDYVLSYGAATGASNEWCTGLIDEHNQATSDTFCSYSTTNCINIYDPGAADSTVDCTAEFSAWITNGIRINWTVAPDAAYLLTVVLFAGTDLSAHANNIALGNTVDAANDITAPGFTPDVILSAMARGEALAFSSMSLGMVHFDGGSTITQRTLVDYLRSNRSTSENILISRNDGGFAEVGPGTLDWYGEFSDFDSNGFSIIERNNGANSQTVCYLALNFGGAVDSWVGDHTTPTSTGDSTDTGPGFEPQFVLSLMSLLEAYGTVYTDNRAGSLGISVFDDDDEYSNVASSEDGVGTTNTQSLSDNTAVNLPDDDGTAELTASFVSFDTNGWTLNYSAVAATAKLWPTLAIETDSAGALSITPDTITSAAVVYEPTLTPQAVTITPDTIASAAVVYEPTLNLNVAPDTITSVAVVYEPTLTVGAVTVAPDTIPSTAVVYEPTLVVGTVTIEPDTIPSAAVVYELTLDLNIAPDAIASAATVYEPTVSVGAVTITPDTIVSGAVVYEPTITVGAVTITPDTIPSAAVVYEPTLAVGAVTITPDTIASASTVYEPTLGLNIALDSIPSAAVVYEPTLTSGDTIAPDTIPSAAIVYELTLTTGAITIEPDSIASAATVYEPTLTPGAVTIAPDSISSAAVVYEPTLDLTIAPDTVASAAVVYEPALTTGAISITPDAIASAAVVYEPTVSSGGAQTIAPDTITSAVTIYTVLITMIASGRISRSSEADRTRTIAGESRIYDIAESSRTYTVK